MKLCTFLKVHKAHKERGSLALEQVLFIAAIVAMSAGIYIFYGKLESYFRNISVPEATQTDISG